MKWASFIAGALAVPAAIAQLTDKSLLVDCPNLDDVQNIKNGIVTASGVQNQGIHPRYEIRQMQNEHSMQMTLLFIGMQCWQYYPTSDNTSYYEVAKIHGVPREGWNYVEQCDGCEGADGFCTHGIMVFPCWHRAYLALFEEHLTHIIQAIAKSWPKEYDGDQFVEAASTWRLPYWDWAATPAEGQPIVPEAMTAPEVTLSDQTGTRRTIPNPLYNFKFADPSNLYYSYYTSWDYTLRYPSNESPQAADQENKFESTMTQNQPAQKENLYTLLAGCNNYFDMSNHRANGSGACTNSLEALHDNIHTWTGGILYENGGQYTGHMAVLPEAAFDPAFWFHHAMVDRIFAMWQTFYPDSYGAGVSQQSDHQTWAYPAGYTYDMNTGLKPFRQNENTFWTCNSVRNWTEFGYTYDDFVWADGDVSKLQQYVQDMYGPDSTLHPGELPGSSNKRREVASGSTNQYFANIETPQFALNGSYTVMMFDGAPSTDDTTDWTLDKNLVGSMGVFSKPGVSQSKSLMTGQVALTGWLKKTECADSLDETTVKNFIKDNLRVYLVCPKGDAVSPSQVEGFRMTISMSTFTPSAGFGEQYSPFSVLEGLAEDVMAKVSAIVGEVGSLL